jgi:hypothetical protein
MAALERVVAGLIHISVVAGAVTWLLDVIFDGKGSKRSRKQSMIMVVSLNMLKIARESGHLHMRTDRQHCVDQKQTLT